MNRGGWRKGVSRAAIATLLLVGIAVPASASAAVITPNTTADEYDAVADATCSLREAVTSVEGSSNFGGCTANGAYATTDTVRLAPGTYTLTIPPGADDTATGDLDFIIGDALSVVALPGGPVVVDGNATDRIVRYTGSLTVDGVTLTNGRVDDPAPGSGVSGGAIANSGGSSLTLTDSTVSGNSADGFGGGISASGPTVLTNVTISDNQSTELGGGGIEVSGAEATLALDHVTVTNNRSLHNEPAQSLVAGGVLVDAPSAAHNSIIAGNTDANATFDAPDCQGAITSQGGNVIGSATGCTFTALASDSVGAPASLGPLADNGGGTETHALLAGSPALGQGIAPCQAADQRGYPRPFPAGGACDSGAYELFTCDGVPLNEPGPFPGCPPPTGGQTPTTPAPPAPLVVDPCPELRDSLARAKKRLKKAKKADRPTKKKCKKVRRLRRELQANGC